MIDKQIDKACDRVHEERICWEIVESVNSIILRWDTDLKVTFINDYGQRFLGYTRDEILGKSLIGTIVPATSTAGSDLTAMIRGIVLHPEQYVNNENENERRDRTRVWISWTNRAIRDSKGNVVEILSVGNDVTRRKRAEDALEKQLKMTQTLLDTIPIPVFYKDTKGIYTGCNQAFADFLGKPKDGIIGKTVYEVSPPDLADIYHRSDEELIHHPGTQVYETSVVSTDGTRRDVVFNKATYINEDGTVGGLIGTILDITKRKNIERELVKAREDLERRVRERTIELEEANRSLKHEVVEHQRDEEALKIRVRFENLITTLSSRFINLAPEEIDRELYGALQKIGEFAGVDRCYIGITSGNGKILDITYEWAAGGIRQYPQFYHNIVANEVYPWSARIVRNLEVLYIPGVEDLPPEADKDKERLQAQQIKSIVVVPMVYKKTLIGIVGFDSVREKKAWTDDDIALLRIVGEIFSNAIERKWIEEALRESEERFRAIFEQAAVGISITSLDGTTLRPNDKMCQITGYSREELVGRNYEYFIYPEDISIDQEEIRKLLKGEISSFSVDKRYVRKSGEIIWAHVTISLARDKERKPQYVIAIVQDITGSKRTDEALRESEERFRATFEQAAVGIAHVAFDGHYLRMNRKYCEIVGYPCNEMIGLTYRDITYPEDLEADEMLQRQLLEGEKQVGSIEKRYIRKDGSLVWVTLTVSVVGDDAGGPKYFIAVVQDITDRKRIEKAVIESEEEFRVLVESSPVAIFFHQGGDFIYVNPAAEKLSGYTKEQLLGMKFWEVIAPEYRALVKERGIARLEGKKPVSRYEVRLLTGDGAERWMELSATLMEFRGKTSILTTALDVTQRRQAEEAMKKARARAELYLDLMGHDISNMNQAMMGYLEMAQELLDLEGHEELIERPLEIIKHSSRLIANVKKLELIQAGKYPIKTVNLCRTLKEVTDAYSVVPDRDVRISLALAEGCCVTANDLLNDVFDNLVDNAIRHSTGPLNVDISTEPVLEDGRKYYMVSVRDNGPGISDDLKRKIFRFIDPATGSPGRRGLGLYMVRTLVESYHGKVWVEDRVPGDYHKGSRFVVLLPAADQGSR